MESEEVQKTLLKVQSALALSQGIAQLQEGIGGIKAMGAELVRVLGKSGLIGIAIAGVAALALVIRNLGKEQSDLERQTQLLNEVNKEANKTAGQEIATLQKLYSVATNTTLSIDKRKEAVGELQKQYPEHFKNIKEEIILQGKASTAYDATKDSILAAARARAIESKLAKLANDELEAEQEKLVTLKKIEQNRLDKIKADAADSDKERRGLNQFAAISAGSELESELGGQNKNLEKIAADREFLLSKITTAGVKTDSPSPVTGKPSPEKYKSIVHEYQVIDQEQTDFEKEQAKLRLDNEASFDNFHKAQLERRVSDSVSATKAVTSAEWQQSQARIRISDAEFDAKMKMAQAEADILSGLSELLGNQTAAGKALAVAATVINTYAAIAGSLRAFSGVPIPGYAIAQAIATGIFGLVQVKKILGVQIPGKGGGGSGANIGSASAPLSPALPQSTTTRLDRDQLNQIGNATVRAFVIESDVSGNQERIRRLNRAARIG